MPKVPQYENSANISTPRTSPGNILSIPKESLGLQQAQAQSNLAQTISGFGETISKIALKKEQEYQEKEALKKELSFKSTINNALYSPDIETIDQDGETIQRPKGYLNRQLSQTKDSVIEFDKTFRDLYDGATEGLSGYQKSLLHPALLSSYESSRNAIIQHQAREEAKDYELTYNATLDQMVSDSAAYENPDDVSQAIDRASVLVNQGMKRMGAQDKAIILRKVQDTVSKIADTNISALLEKDPNKALEVFEKIKGKLPADTKEVLAAKISDKQFVMKRTAIWDALSDEHRLDDGSYNLEAFRDEIDTLKGFTPEQKSKLYTYVEGRARDAEQALKKSKAANYSQFMTEAIQAKDQGISYDQNLALAAKYAGTPIEREKMENDIFKLYDKIKTNPEVYNQLYQELKTGELTEDRLEDYRDQLSGTDFKMFKKGVMDQVVNPRSNAAYKEVNNTIKVLMDKEFGSNKERKNDFLTALYETHEKEGGGSPDQLLQRAKDLLKDVKVNNWPIFNKKPKYQIESNRIKEDREYKSTLENALGRNMVQEIGRGMMRSKGNKSFSASDLKEFVDKFGGYDKIQPGTDAYKAINFLIENKKQVNPSTVQQVIDYFNKR
jgi:hypothetical protein